MTASDRSKDWRQLVTDAWPAVPAVELLGFHDGVWAAEGLSAPMDDEAVALAAVGRLVRYGQSISIALPISRETTLPRLAFYLHRLRLDASQGLLRSPWFNRVEMAQRKDLIVFGRPRRMLRDFASSIVMRPKVVAANTDLEDSDAQRTLLASGHGDLLRTLELLEGRSRPFAIVVDVSASGCDDNSLGLIRALPTAFDGVPIVAIGYTGQVLAEPLRMHAWNVRLGDRLQLTGRPQPKGCTRLELIAPRDSVMNAFAKRLGFLVWNLKRMMETAGGRSHEFAALAALDRTLRCLNVPLSVHERDTTPHVRGGQFAVRTVNGWLETAARMRGRRGDIQALLDEILGLVRTTLKQLHEAVPGRSELLLKVGTDAIQRREPLAILVGGARDAIILQNWMETELGPDATQFVTVCSMDGANSVPPSDAAVAIYAAPLFPSRLHWLGLNAVRKLVVCHPFEEERVKRQLDSW